MKVKSTAINYGGDEHGVWVYLTVELDDGNAFRIATQRDDDNLIPAARLAGLFRAAAKELDRRSDNRILTAEEAGL
jgi:hypothetical protein